MRDLSGQAVTFIMRISNTGYNKKKKMFVDPIWTYFCHRESACSSLFTDPCKSFL